MSKPPPVPPIRGLEPLSLTAWEGRVAAVIQLQGCNFKCPACAVPHLVSQSGDIGELPYPRVLEAIYRRRRWLDAVVISGGEPTLHAGLLEFCKLVREFGLPVRVHTNGSHPGVLRELLDEGDVGHVSMTIRAPLDPSYSVAAGTRVRLAAIYESVELLLRQPGVHEFRVPWLQYVVEDEQMKSIVRMLAGARRVVLECDDRGRPGRARLEAIAREVGHEVQSCVVAGRPVPDFGSVSRSRGVAQ